MTSTTNDSQVLLDNAFLFSAANLRNSRRNVNILGLSALADAIVMHQRITVDSKGWEYFENNVPPQWLPYISPLVDVVTYQLPPIETITEKLIKDPRALLACYLMSEVDFLDLGIVSSEAHSKNFDINYYYLTYTGSEIADETGEEELLRLIDVYRPKAIPEMQFNHRWSDHISTLQCLVRAMQYDAFAANRGEAYLSHEFRGRVLNIFSQQRASTKYKNCWVNLMAKVSTLIENEFKEHLEWASPLIEDSHALWLRLETPIFLSQALQKCTSAKDLFAHVADIREKARPVRELLQTLTSGTSNEGTQNAVLEMRRLSYELTNTQPTPHDTKLSLSIGLPISASFGIDIPTKQKSRSVSFIRDIYDNYAIPYNLVEDIKRCFKFDRFQHLTDVNFPNLSNGENLMSSVVYSSGGAEKESPP